MVLCWIKQKGLLRKMMSLPLCCKTSSAALVVLVAVAILGKLTDADTTTTAKTKATTTSKPFLQSPLFIGLAGGVGGFIGLIVLLCFLWKCCCSDKD